jgi:hypothetical protein
MTLERLNALAVIAIESDTLEKIDYEDIIKDFIFMSTMRIVLFK